MLSEIRNRLARIPFVHHTRSLPVVQVPPEALAVQPLDRVSPEGEIAHVRRVA